MMPPGMVLSQPTSTTRPSNPLPRATSSIESAITSRLTSDARIPSVPIVMPSEIETVLNSIGVRAGGANALLHVLGERAQVQVAGADLDPGVGHADERLPQVGVGEAGALEHGARGRAARAGRQRVGSVGASRVHLEGIGRRRASPRPACSCGYEPSTRSIGANSRQMRQRPRARHIVARRRQIRRRTGIPTCGRESAAIRASSGRCRAARTRSAP